MTHLYSFLRTKRLLAVLSALFCGFFAQAHPHIVPCPQEVVWQEGRFSLRGKTCILHPSLDMESRQYAEAFAATLSQACGQRSRCKVSAPTCGGIRFLPDSTLAEDAYTLAVTRKGISIKAAGPNGFLYAIATLKQLLPPAIYSPSAAPGEDWSVPCCLIQDAPRFAYRGLMIDSCRHFWSLDEMRKIIDVLACYKFNRLHWHLSDDQGWRIEIKQYPRLTEVGAWRDGTMTGKQWGSNDGIRYGGFYTQEELREVIAYAAQRGITIIPEIDLPGHMLAAIAAYPELGCEGCGPWKVWDRWGISEQVLCVGREETMVFLENVLGEVAGLFPGEYIHIGGDECPRKEWKTDPFCQAKIQELGLTDEGGVSAEARLQNYVTARMQAFLATKGKKIIGWDEVLEGELAPGATVMSWRGSKGGIKAASMGFDVIMTPNTYCYLDYCQSYDVESEPLCITNPKRPRSAVPLSKLYGWDPFEGIAPEYRQHILGLQGNLWTEYIATPEYLEYMLLPRLLALSEVQWCDEGQRDFPRFQEALRQHQFAVLDALGCRYRDKIE